MIQEVEKQITMTTTKGTDNNNELVFFKNIINRETKKKVDEEECR